MEQNLRCTECGQELSADDLNCWACGALTSRGRAQRLGGDDAADEDDEWRKSVEAAKARKQQTPQVDPDEALEQVLAQQGMTDEVTRVSTLTKSGLDSGDPVARDRTEYADIRDTQRALTTLAMGLGALLAVLAVVVIAYSLSLLANDDPMAPIAGFGVGIFIVVAAAITYYMFRIMSELIGIFADTADNTRRTVAALRTLQTEVARLRDTIASSQDAD